MEMAEKHVCVCCFQLYLNLQGAAARLLAAG